MWASERPNKKTRKNKSSGVQQSALKSVKGGETQRRTMEKNGLAHVVGSFLVFPLFGRVSWQEALFIDCSFSFVVSLFRILQAGVGVKKGKAVFFLLSFCCLSVCLHLFSCPFCCYLLPSVLSSFFSGCERRSRFHVFILGMLCRNSNDSTALRSSDVLCMIMIKSHHALLQLQ